MSDTDNQSDHEDMLSAVRAAMDSHADQPTEALTNIDAEPDHQARQDAVDMGDQVAAVLNAEEKQREQPTSKNRDGRGRFASTNPAAPDAPSSISPPTSWTAEAKAEWEKLPPHLQDAVLKREMEIDNGFRQHSDERQRLKEIDNLIAPRRESLAQYGFKSDAEAINQLLTISDGFSQNPVGTLQMLAQHFGIKPEQLFSGMTAAPTQDQIEAYAQQYAAVEVAKAEVRHWEKTAGEHYGMVKPLMRQLLANGAATDMDTAYKMAMAQHPAVQSIEAQKRTSQRRERQMRATNASLNGAPHGVPAAAPRNRNAGNGKFGEIADDVRAAMNSLL
jgi:hypothetical protein